MTKWKYSCLGSHGLCGHHLVYGLPCQLCIFCLVSFQHFLWNWRTWRRVKYHSSAKTYLTRRPIVFDMWNHNSDVESSLSCNRDLFQAKKTLLVHLFLSLCTRHGVQAFWLYRTTYQSVAAKNRNSILLKVWCAVSFFHSFHTVLHTW